MWFLDFMATLLMIVTIWLVLGVINHYFGFENTVLLGIALIMYDIIKRMREW